MMNVSSCSCQSGRWALQWTREDGRAMVRPAERADSRTNRARILATAVALFAERGIDAEMRDIAERAGLAVGTVYNHFPSKDALLVAVLQRAIAEVEQVAERACD